MEVVVTLLVSRFDFDSRWREYRAGLRGFNWARRDNFLIEFRQRITSVWAEHVCLRLGVDSKCEGLESMDVELDARSMARLSQGSWLCERHVPRSVHALLHIISVCWEEADRLAWEDEVTTKERYRATSRLPLVVAAYDWSGWLGYLFSGAMPARSGWDPVQRPREFIDE